MNSFEVISVLEEKVESLLNYVKNLEEEKRNLVREMENKDSALAELKSKVESLEGEREQVSSRVEQMLQKINSVTMATAEAKGDDRSEQQGQGGFEFTD